MAKIVKKKAPAKPAAKPAKKAAAKPAKSNKPAAKVIKKPVAKAPVKAAAPVKKKAAAPAKPAPKAVVKKAAPVKPTASKKSEVKAKAEKEVKGKKPVATPAVEKKADKKAAAPVMEKPAKKDAKAPTKADKKTKAKKEENDLEDDFISDDDYGNDEIGEYEEELKVVEEADEEVDLSEEWVAEERNRGDEEIVLTDAEGRRYCRSRDCDQIAVVDVYCRYHYLMFWKKIQVRKKILVDGKLERYVEELTARYPDKFLEMIRRDLRTEKDFLGAIQELEIDESAGENEFEEDNSAFIEEVRGMGEGSGASVEEDDY